MTDRARWDIPAGLDPEGHNIAMTTMVLDDTVAAVSLMFETILDRVPIPTDAGTPIFDALVGTITFASAWKPPSLTTRQRKRMKSRLMRDTQRVLDNEGFKR